MAVPVETGAAFQPGVPKLLFQARFATLGNAAPYDASADGRRFLIATPLEETSDNPITVVLNWQAGLGTRR